MKRYNRTLRGLASCLLFALALAGCSKAPEAEPGSAGNAQKSEGVLSKLVSSPAPVTVPEGTVITVTADQSISSNQQRSGDQFAASVAEPVVVNGKTVIPRGAHAIGRVVEAKESGRLKGVAELRLELTSVDVDGKAYDVHTTTITRTGGGHTKRNAVMIGGGTGAGALIGGLAGGGKGALIGGAVGAGAGTATAAATGKKEIAVPAETPLSFKLTQPLTVRVKS